MLDPGSALASLRWSGMTKNLELGQKLTALLLFDFPLDLHNII
jgi:hypothetical protein